MTLDNLQGYSQDSLLGTSVIGGGALTSDGYASALALTGNLAIGDGAFALDGYTLARACLPGEKCVIVRPPIHGPITN